MMPLLLGITLGDGAACGPLAWQRATAHADPRWRWTFWRRASVRLGSVVRPRAALAAPAPRVTPRAEVRARARAPSRARAEGRGAWRPAALANLVRAFSRAARPRAGAPGRRWLQRHTSATRLRQPDRDRLLRRARAVFALPDVLHLFTDELTGGGGRSFPCGRSRFAFSSVALLGMRKTCYRASGKQPRGARRPELGRRGLDRWSI